MSKKHDQEEDDPRADLVRRLQEYERYKQAAEALEALPRVGRDIFETRVLAPYAEAVKVQPKVTVDDLISAMRDVLARAEMFSHHHVQMER